MYQWIVLLQLLHFSPEKRFFEALCKRVHVNNNKQYDERPYLCISINGIVVWPFYCDNIDVQTTSLSQLANYRLKLLLYSPLKYQEGENKNIYYNWVNIILQHCVKSVQIRSYFWSVFNLNTGKSGPEITPYLDTFHAVQPSRPSTEKSVKYPRKRESIW